MAETTAIVHNCFQCDGPIEDIGVVDRNGRWFHQSCWRNWTWERIENLKDALRPFAEIWDSPEPRYPLDEDYKRASEYLAEFG